MKVLILNTGGTFNKRYNPLKGELEVPSDNIALNSILNSCFNVDYEVKNIISKDSLDIDAYDRELIVQNIENSNFDNIIIIHGTDTVDITASYLEQKITNKKIVLTGAMVPMSIEKVEATMNFSLALGFLSADVHDGIYLAMHGIVLEASKLIKNREEGKFLSQS
jgi:L-asparaginase